MNRYQGLQIFLKIVKVNLHFINNKSDSNIIKLSFWIVYDKVSSQMCKKRQTKMGQLRVQIEIIFNYFKIYSYEEDTFWKIFFYFFILFSRSLLDLFNFNDSTYSKYYYTINEHDIGNTDKFV